MPKELDSRNLYQKEIISQLPMKSRQYFYEIYVKVNIGV